MNWIFSKKTWKLGVPILFVLGIIILSFYSRDLLKYGNRKVYPIEEIVGVIMLIIIGISVILILFIIEIYLENYLQEQEIIKLEKELIKVK